ncbi:MAG: hypothetical protein ACTFAK_09290 [Candidatus Electronema sp. VV]
MEENKNLPAAEQADESREMTRRQALATLGKLAIYTAPVLTTLTMKVDKAAAQIGSATPPGPPPV